MTQVEDHLRVHSIFHYVVAGLACPFALLCSSPSGWCSPPSSSRRVDSLRGIGVIRSASPGLGSSVFLSDSSSCSCESR